MKKSKITTNPIHEHLTECVQGLKSPGLLFKISYKIATQVDPVENSLGFFGPLGEAIGSYRSMDYEEA